MNTQITPSQLESLGNSIGMTIDNFAAFHDGFSFTVPTELEAYKAAYHYRYSDKVTVKFSPNVSLWSVSVYNK